MIKKIITDIVFLFFRHLPINVYHYDLGDPASPEHGSVKAFPLDGSGLRTGLE